MCNCEKIKIAEAIVADYEKRIVALKRDIEGMKQHKVYRCDQSITGARLPFCPESNCENCVNAIIIGS